MKMVIYVVITIAVIFMTLLSGGGGVSEVSFLNH